jgi:hypothetical protein
VIVARDGKPVANKSLWQQLIDVVKTHERVEWSSVKAHSGIVLNECADVPATRGVMNENASDAPQFVIPVDEDSDSHGYFLPDGEETLTDDCTAERPPQ